MPRSEPKHAVRKRFRRKAKRLRLGTYPYTVTRARVMRSFLLKPPDYLRMQQMGLNELIRFLEEGQYKQEIDQLAAKHTGATLLELSLNANLAKTLNKLLSISHKKELRFVLATYANKWVFANLKTVLRARINRLPPDSLSALIPISPTTEPFCQRLLEADDAAVARTLHEVAGLDLPASRKHLAERNLLALENALDRSHYEQLSAFTHRVRASRKDPLKEFFHLTVDLMNLKNLLRLKATGAEPAAIRSTLVLDPEMNKKYRVLWDHFIRARDIAAMRKAAKGSRFADLLSGADLADLPAFERSIERYLLAYSFRLLRKKPLSVSPVFGFLLNKELEVRNIRLLLHAKSLSLPPEFVSGNLVLPERRAEAPVAKALLESAKGGAR